MADFKESHWVLLDLQYEYLDDGFKLTATTDVPVHLYCRMTKTQPLKHRVPSPRRGTYLEGEVRFCFVVYEDNEQVEAGDTLTHTWYKDAWPICETRWFYFIGTQGGTPSVSETCQFCFHFPAPPPEPPGPIIRQFIASVDNRTIRSNWGTWGVARNGISLSILPNYEAPAFRLNASHYGPVSYTVLRSFLSFDTSGIPLTARLVSARIQLYNTSVLFTWGGLRDICATQGLQSTPVVENDWYLHNAVNVVLASRSIETITNGQYNDFVLNNAGLSLIDLSGLTRFAMRTENDVLNVDPGLHHPRSIHYHSQQKGLGYRPILEVSYYPA